MFHTPEIDRIVNQKIKINEIKKILEEEISYLTLCDSDFKLPKNFDIENGSI